MPCQTTPRPVPNAEGAVVQLSTPSPRQSHVPQSAKPGHSTSFHFRAELNPNPPRPNPLHPPMPHANAPPPPNSPLPPATPKQPPAITPPNPPPQKKPHLTKPPPKHLPHKTPTHSKHKTRPIDFQSTYLYINTINIILPSSFLPSLPSFLFYRQPLPCARPGKFPAAVAGVKIGVHRSGPIAGHLMTEKNSRPEQYVPCQTTPRPVPNAATTRPNPNTPARAVPAYRSARTRPAGHSKLPFPRRAESQPATPHPLHPPMPHANAPPPPNSPLPPITTPPIQAPPQKKNRPQKKPPHKNPAPQPAPQNPPPTPNTKQNQSICNRLIYI